MKRTFLLLLAMAALISCSKKEEGTKSPDLKYTLETVDGVILEGELAREPSCSLTITSGKSDLYDISYTVDDGREAYMRDVAVNIPVGLECVSTEGSHSVSGTIEGDSGELCRFSCTYKVTREDDVYKIYYDPEVKVTVKDTIPASGGSVDSAEVTYRQRCVTTDGKDSTVSYVTAGGKVEFGEPVTAESLGDLPTKELLARGKFSASVKMNGRTGTGYDTVYQAVNRVEKIAVRTFKTQMYIGDTTRATVGVTYTSGTVKRVTGAVYSASAGNVITISQTESVITANRCGTEGSEATLTAAYGDLTASTVVTVCPVCRNLGIIGNSYFTMRQAPYEYAWSASAWLRCEKGGAETHTDVTSNSNIVINTGDAPVTMWYAPKSGGVLKTFNVGSGTVTVRLFGCSAQKEITVTSY